MKNTKYKLFLLVSKYMPVVIAIGIFINIILAIIYKPLFIVNIIFGSSVTISISNYITSITFKFCKWHRILINYAIFYQILMFIDSYVYNLSNTILSNMYYLSVLSILIFIYAYINRNVK